MNNKGFMMAEVVVVSAVVLVTLTALYTSYNKIYSAYDRRVDYYDVPTLYELAYIRDNTDLSSFSSMTSIETYDSKKKVYFLDRYDLINLDVKYPTLNQTFKDYLAYLNTSLDSPLKFNDVEVKNILVMENCLDSDDCKYAYLEVLNEEDA